MTFCRLPLIALLALSACEDPPAAKTNPKPTPVDTPAAAPASAASAAPAPLASEPTPAAHAKRAEDCPKSSNVLFDDKTFEAEVRKKLVKPSGDITKLELGKLKSLNVSSVKLRELDPCVFPHMKALKELFLGPGDYSDVSPLAGLTQLESLRASISRVKDITPLSGMVKLDRLDLGRTLVEDISPLANMKSLTELQLDDTPVENLAPLAKASKLQRLSIQRTHVKDASALKGLTALKFLYIAGTPLDDDPTLLSPVRARGVKIIAD
jgi:internalin A